ncbi:hypothetical protein GRI62_03885 [Erythrobacter arachoides]|uniref:Uncharacterized protein n=1 Tax=Aurantiacibacter arachoides TaxID=1850444 RepID=A0A844ZYG8_9SPHN|nr:hypothetical protein [Aurantiacibacter arachoides]MXO92748.1 hypothetical protein [Aurantiacibacter arachoides]GGD54790.1 hypothetical protein GCM10011411_13420 [Aurantiacibacter arachoides]
MTKLKAMAKGTFATLAAGAMTLSAAAPAAAQDRWRDRDDDGIGAGEIIAGAVILGGLAAILGSGRNDRYDDYRYRDSRDYRYNDSRYGDYRNGYDGYGQQSSRRAVEQCVGAAEQYAQRRLGSRAEVYEIADIDRENRGYEVKGRIAVRDDYRYADRRSRYGYRDYSRGNRNQGWDEGRFECDYRNGRVVGIDFSGIRGL